jgi:hypothetical protein
MDQYPCVYLPFHQAPIRRPFHIRHYYRDKKLIFRYFVKSQRSKKCCKKSMFTVILSVESVNFFTFSLIYLCKLESQKVLAQFTDAPSCATILFFPDPLPSFAFSHLVSFSFSHYAPTIFLPNSSCVSLLPS